MARSRIHLKNVDMEKDNYLYNLPASIIIAQFKPQELYALLKLEPKDNDTCTMVLKIHLQFLKIEAYEWCVVTRDYMENYCY